MSHGVHDLCHSGALCGVAGDQPEIFASDTVRHDKRKLRHPSLCFSHDEPSLGRVATVEDDVDATGFERRHDLRELHLSRFHLLDEREPYPKLLEPPLDFVRDAFAIRLTVM